MKAHPLIILALLTPLLLTSCGLVYKDWRQPPGGPAAEAAWFKHHRADPLVTGSLDGRSPPLFTDESCTVFAIAPGWHTFSARRVGSKVDAQSSKFNASPGRCYHATTDTTYSGGHYFFRYRIEEPEWWTEERRQEAIAKLDQRR